jgi:hypothetical protein
MEKPFRGEDKPFLETEKRFSMGYQQINNRRCVADPAVPGEGEIKAVREFNFLLSGDPRFQTTVLPLRDGVNVALRVRA